MCTNVTTCFLVAWRLERNESYYPKFGFCKFCWQAFLDAFQLFFPVDCYSQICLSIMPSNLVSLCVILAFFVAQIYIFFCVERIEIRVALAIFSAYQIYQKSRKFRPGSGPKGSDSEQTKADNWAAPKPRNMTSMILRLVVFTMLWGLGIEAVNFGTGSSRLEDNAEAAADFNKIVEDTEWVEQSTNPWMKTNIALLVYL